MVSLALGSGKSDRHDEILTHLYSDRRFKTKTRRCELVMAQGYRVYFVQQGETLIILLAGGDKGTQQRDIKTALDLAQDV